MATTTQDQREANLIAIDNLIAARREREAAARRRSRPSLSRGPSVRDQVIRFFEQHPTAWYTATEVDELAGLREMAAAKRITELVREGRITTDGEGRYRLA